MLEQIFLRAVLSMFLKNSETGDSFNNGVVKLDDKCRKQGLGWLIGIAMAIVFVPMLFVIALEYIGVLSPPH